MHLYNGRVMGINHYKQPFKKVMDHITKTDLSKIKLKIDLVAEPDNPYDPNAIMVFFGDDGKVFEHIGYVAKPQNIACLEAGLENLKVEITNFNKFKDEFVGIEILVTRNE